MVDEGGQFVRERRSHDGESVGAAGILPGDHVVGQLFGRADKVCLGCATADLRSDLTQCGPGLGLGGRQQLFGALITDLRGGQLGGQWCVRIERVRVQT